MDSFPPDVITPPPLSQLESVIRTTLDDLKAEDIVSIDLVGKADFSDRMIIASGTSQRHLVSLADRVVQALKELGFSHIPVEGKETGEWVLVDAGNIIVHLFHPDMRRYYNLEKMWSAKLPQMEAVV